MQRKLKKFVGMLMIVTLVAGMTLSVHAATYTGEYAGGTYSATMQFNSSYTVVALSYSTESPSDAQYTSVNGYISHDSNGNYANVNISGMNGCYRMYNGSYNIGSCGYHIGATTVRTIIIL